MKYLTFQVPPGLNEDQNRTNLGLKSNQMMFKIDINMAKLEKNIKHR